MSSIFGPKGKNKITQTFIHTTCIAVFSTNDEVEVVLGTSHEHKGSKFKNVPYCSRGVSSCDVTTRTALHV